MKSYIVTIPRQYPTLNKWSGRWYFGYKKRWGEYVSAALSEARVPQGNRRVRLVIRHFFTANRKRDEDNYNPKLLLDSFTRAGIIPNDTPEFIDWTLGRRETGEIGWVDRKYPRVEIEVQIVE